MFEKRRLKRQGESGQGVVTRAQKKGGQRTSDGQMTTINYEVTVKMRFEDGGEFERSLKVGGLTGTGLSFGPGDVVPTLFDPDDHSSFIIDERKMNAEQDARLADPDSWKNEEQLKYERQMIEEAEGKLPPTSG